MTLKLVLTRRDAISSRNALVAGVCHQALVAAVDARDGGEAGQLCPLAMVC